MKINYKQEYLKKLKQDDLKFKDLFKHFGVLDKLQETMHGRTFEMYDIHEWLKSSEHYKGLSEMPNRKLKVLLATFNLYTNIETATTQGVGEVIGSYLIDQKEKGRDIQYYKDIRLDDLKQEFAEVYCGQDEYN